MGLLKEYVRKELDTLMRNDIRFKVIGRIGDLNSSVQEELTRAVEATAGNTGGMGAYSPAPVVTPELFEEACEQVIRPMVEGMAREGVPYVGILYAGLMIKDGATKVLEFNCRFGDPECQPIVMRMQGDLVPVLEACIDGKLADVTLEWDSRATVCVVQASEGYPGSYPKGVEIQGLDAAAELEDVVVFHAGTKLQNGKVVTSGGRVLGVTAIGDGVSNAIDRAYRAVEVVGWPGVHWTCSGPLSQSKQALANPTIGPIFSLSRLPNTIWTASPMPISAQAHSTASPSHARGWSARLLTI
jgi:hypothetical protein